MPLIIELNKWKKRPSIFLSDNELILKRMGEIEGLSKKYNFDIHKIEQINNFPSNITFMIEGDSGDKIKYKTKKAVLTLETIFTENRFYPVYINKVDYVFINSKKFFDSWAEKDLYGGHFKNQYLGSPKYDIKLSSVSRLLNKYQIRENNILVIYPNRRDQDLVNIDGICKTILSCGFQPVIKIRDKYPYSNSEYKIIDDASIFPHPTMELIKASKIVINFTSSAIEEIVELRKPCINIHIKPFMQMPYLYNYSYCRKMPVNYSDKDLKKNIEDLSSNDYSKEFDKCFSECLTNSLGCCERILALVNEEGTGKK